MPADMPRFTGFAATLLLVATGGPALADDAPAKPACDLQCQDRDSYPVGKDGKKTAGDVFVRACYTKPGPPDEIKLEKSSGHPELDAAAVRSVKSNPNGPFHGEGPFEKRCDVIRVTFDPAQPQHPAGTGQHVPGAGFVALNWRSDKTDASPVDMPQCDEHCQDAIDYPAGKDGQHVGAYVHVTVCFNPEGEVDSVAVNPLYRAPPELAQASRAFVRLLKMAPFVGTGMPSHRCHLAVVAFKPEAGPTG